MGPYFKLFGISIQVCDTDSRALLHPLQLFHQFQAFSSPPDDNIVSKVVVNTMISPIMRDKRSESDFEQMSTPAHRPVNMHISKPVQAPQPISLLEEDDQETIKQESRKKYKFLLSAMEPQEKIRYSALVEKLGGVICEAQYFTMECTHAIVGTPSR